MLSTPELYCIREVFSERVIKDNRSRPGNKGDFWSLQKTFLSYNIYFL